MCVCVPLRTDIDGAYFGTTFPHIFLMTFPALVPSRPPQTYIPRIFGFKVFKGPLPGEARAITDEEAAAAAAAGGGGGGGGGGGTAPAAAAAPAKKDATPLSARAH